MNNYINYKILSINAILLSYALLILLRATPLRAQNHHAILFPETPSSIFNDLRAHEIRTRFTDAGSQCVLSSGSTGVCGPLDSCDELRSLYQRGQRLSRRNFEILRSRICRISGNQNILFCCSASPSGPPVRGAVTGVSSNRNSELIPTKSQCGISTGGRIIKGKAIDRHSHPWLVNLGSLTGNRFKQMCGGTLVTRRHVLTAAHCYVKRRGVSPISHARLGDHSLSKAEAEPEITLRIIGRKSPGYNTRSQENDIELLQLERDVSFTANIRPACLPFGMENKNFTSDSMTIIGWGDTIFRSNQGSDTPLGAEVPVISKSACQQAYIRQTSVVIDDRQICAGVGGEDACQGDSGGPMIYKDTSSRHYFIGIVSFGIECARKDFPGVYTFIPNFLDWIQSNL